MTDKLISGQWLVGRDWMKIFKRKPKKLIQARFIYDTSRIGVHSNYSDWQTVSEKEFKCAVSDAKKDGWTDVKYIVLGNIVSDKYDIKGFEKREIKWN